MNQFVDLSMENTIHHRFQIFTQLRVIFADERNLNQNDDASSTGDACHMRITAERRGLLAIVIEHGDHSCLDRIVREFKTITYAEFLKDIVEMSFDGALGY
jgi:hypothetical protein